MVAIAFSTAPPTRHRPAPSAATYRHRRLVVAAVAVLALVLVLNVAASLLGVGHEPGDVGRARPVAELSVVVQPGDTIWSIADTLAQGRDVRPYVDALVEANGGSSLQTGERLVVVLP